MKKSLLATLILGSSLGMTSCGGSSSSATSTPKTSPSGSSTPVAQEVVKSGVYSYENYGHTYGMAVKVTFNGEKKITKVERDADKIAELKLVEITQGMTSQQGWDSEAMQELYDEKLTESLAKFNNVGAEAYYTEAAAALSAINPADNKTWPAKDSAFGTKYFVDTGATQSNSRLAAAVANACAELLGKTKLTVAKPSSGDETDPKPSTTPSTSATTSATTSAATSSATTSTPASSSTPSEAETPAA